MESNEDFESIKDIIASLAAEVENAIDLHQRVDVVNAFASVMMLIMKKLIVRRIYQSLLISTVDMSY